MFNYCLQLIATLLFKMISVSLTKTKELFVVTKRRLGQTRFVRFFKERHGLVIFIAYSVVSAVICCVSFCNQDSLRKLFAFLPFYIDKTALLGIVLTIEVCVITTLTLSLTIEGDKNSLKFLLTPKQLNEFIDRPISLECCFSAAFVYLGVSIVLLRMNSAPVFYVHSFLSLAYFFLTILRGLPILKGEDRTVLKKLSRIIEKNQNEKEAAMANKVIKHMLNYGFTISDIFEMVLKSNKKIDKEELRKGLLKSLVDYILDDSTKERDIKEHRKHLCSIVRKLVGDDCESPFNKCRMEFFNALHAMQKKDQKNNEVYDTVFETAFLYSDRAKNKENHSLIRYLFARFTALSLQAGDMSFFLEVKKGICRNEFLFKHSKNGQLYFFTISFLLYAYYYDEKVLQTIKDHISSLKEALEPETRYSNMPWREVLLKVVRGDFSIKMKDFLGLINEYGDWFEFEIFNRAYSPAITEENALEWYWTFLCFSDQINYKSHGIEDYIDDDYTRNYYFEQFFKSVNGGKTEKYQNMLNFFFGLPNGKSLSFDTYLKSKLDSYFNQRKKRELDEELSNNNKGLANAIKECEDYLNQQFQEFGISGEQRQNQKAEIIFYQRYNIRFGESLNKEIIFYNSRQFLAQHIFGVLQMTRIKRDKDGTYSSLKRFITDPKNAGREGLYANKKFRTYCKRGILPVDCKEFVNEENVFDSPIFFNPTLFAAGLPFIGDVKVKVGESLFTDKDYEAFKKSCDNGDGVYFLDGIRYNENELLEAIDKTYAKLIIRITYNYSLNDAKGFSLVYSDED